jgi:hypothetical protein
MEHAVERVNFRQMKDGTKEEYDFLTEHETEYAAGTADRLLKALVELDESLSGYQVTRLGHSLQSATRAWRDGADIDWVVSTLLHDIGDIYAPYNHDEYAAAVIRPFVREQCAWTVEKHGDFQMLITANMWGPIRTSGMPFVIARISRIAPCFVNAGINPALILITTCCRSPSLRQWCATSSPALPMTQQLPSMVYAHRCKMRPLQHNAPFDAVESDLICPIAKTDTHLQNAKSGTSPQACRRIMRGLSGLLRP